VGIHARDYVLPPLPPWTDYPALLVGAVAFAMLFVYMRSRNAKPLAVANTSIANPYEDQ